MSEILNRALGHHRAGQFEAAEQSYRQAIALDPSSVEAKHGLAIILLQSDRAAQAVELLDVRPDQADVPADVMNTRGVALMQIGDARAAVECFESAVKRDCDYSKALANLGVARFNLDELTASRMALERSLTLDGDNTETLYNYGRTLRALGCLEEAEQATRQALKSDPSSTSILFDLASTLAALGKFEEAEACYRRLVENNPNAEDSHHNLGTLLLQTEQFFEGWQEFESRWQTEAFKDVPSFLDLPFWGGSEIGAGRLLVWAEQGIGDQILFSSMFSDLESHLKDQGVNPERVTVACSDRLVPIFKRSFGFANVLSMQAARETLKKQGKISAQVPMGSLGRFLRKTPQSFQTKAPFLLVDEIHKATLRDKYRALSGGKPVIGCSWRSGNPRSGAAKSISLLDLIAPLSALKATFIDLQYDNTVDERREASEDGIDVVRDESIDPLTSMDSFAAQVAAMDLVITTSNTTAHVAGALGVPCWVLLPKWKGLFWYWFLDRSDSPWYPSVRLFRQTTSGLWSDVVENVRDTLLSRYKQ